MSMIDNVALEAHYRQIASGQGRQRRTAI